MMSKVLISVLAALALNTCAAYTEQALADEVTNLPGSEGLDINFKQFSGYLNIPGVNGEKTKFMHYWYVESEKDPATAPLAFWTNGGPGCSGLLGFLTEQGPFHPNKDMSLTLNEYAWNKISNMVFIESPAGVGFSYSSNKEEDYTTGDAQTARDNYNLIQAFLERFPDLKANDLYISSESYGGHYMPTLAKEIVDQNAAGNNELLNFKGFAVGNPYTDVYSGTGAMLDTFWGHQLVPKPTYDEYKEYCINSKRPNLKKCAELTAKLNADIGNLNPYALDYPVCLDSAGSRTQAQHVWMLNHLFADFSAEQRKKMGLVVPEEYEPCESDYSQQYLNTKAVKAALHVEENILWQPCSYKISYNMSDSEVSTAPIYNYLIDGGFGLDILVFSGDDDSICATIGTQAWIWDLGYEVSGKAWETYTVSGQVAGYQTQWKNTKMGFVTVHGAGHEVPAYKPEVALDLWSKYLAGDFTKA